MMLEKQIRILIEQYEKEYIDFMQIANLPSYELELFELNLSEINTTGFGSFAQAIYIPKTDEHILRVSSNAELMKYVFFMNLLISWIRRCMQKRILQSVYIFLDIQNTMHLK